LWIELLKSAYYTEPSKYTQLETLPNIDINIKQGNSLVSRFALDADLSKALKSIKYSIEDYRSFVNSYKNATDKEEKRGFETLINQIKSDFRSTFYNNIPEYKKLAKLKGDLTNLITTNIDLFGKKHNEEDLKVELRRYELSIEKQQKIVDEIRNNAIYKDAFEWRFEFPEVLDRDGNFNGFNVVIGNPPYIRIQDLRQTSEGLVEYYNGNYDSTNSGNYDLYIPFVELGYKILKTGGDFCFIMPHKFINASYGARLREFIVNNSSLRRIVHFGAEQVFADATTYTGLFFMSKRSNEIVEFLQCDNFDILSGSDEILFQNIPSKSLTKDEWNFLDLKSNRLLSKLSTKSLTLEELTDRIYQGLKTSADKIYILQKINQSASTYTVFCRENEREYEIEKSILFPLIKGGDSSSFKMSNTDLLILFPYENGKLISSQSLNESYPLAWKYLNEHKPFLESRENGKFKGTNWYTYGRNQALDVISKAKLFTPDIAPSPRFSYDENGGFMFTGGVSGGYGIVPKSGVSSKYLLAVLNSPVTAWYISKTSTQMRGGWFSFESRYIKSVPIPKQPKDISLIEEKVNQIIAITNSDTTGKESIHNEINNLVYQLYGLTEDEIRIVDEC
jgi:adenine-specific DNA-methyltransferase